MARFKITNTGSVPLVLTWHRDLLDPQDRAAYDAYRNSPDYLGRDPLQHAKKSRRGEYINMKPFFQNLARGVLIRYYNNVNGVAEPYNEYSFVLGCDYEKMLSRDLDTIKEQCDRFNITIMPTDTKRSLVDKIREKAGDNVKVIDGVQLKAIEPLGIIEREIKQRLQPGQATPVIVVSGYIKVEELEDFDEPVETYVGSSETYAEDLLKEMSYRELQSLAKERKLPYVGVSQEKLIQSLLNG